ncbi:BnaC07g13640D [Brassica napus]|uniref:(rape) hypothetical protein n=1 Tax=Brassica napus TaxID=3708 RepID=A0A078FHS8_BRANA|nr:unnamed protein product [Brassica napus]CDY12524.1 BnaC07g13640D [Brassica napus]
MKVYLNINNRGEANDAGTRKVIQMSLSQPHAPQLTRDLVLEEPHSKPVPHCSSNHDTSESSSLSVDDKRKSRKELRVDHAASIVR